MTFAEQHPILASDRISDVLKHHPDLLDTLVEISPAFAKLRNPVMRRVQSRLVTVAHAAGIAGLEAAVLTQKLNRAAGLAQPASVESGATNTVPKDTSPKWLSQVKIVSEIDVRPIMDQGGEPFKEIMAMAQSVPTGSGFRLLAGFEPLPLYDVLATQGFAHTVERHSDDRWDVVFLREQRAEPNGIADSPPRPASTDAVDWSVLPSAEVTIDVSELVPPEPMIKILETLESLPADGRLLVHHVRRPIHLYDRLDEIGYAHETHDLGPGQVEVLIQKRPASAQ